MKTNDLLILGAVGVGAYMLLRGGIFKSINDASDGAGDLISGGSSAIADIGSGGGAVLTSIGEETGSILDNYSDYVSDYWAFPFTPESRENVQNKFYGFGQSVVSGAQNSASAVISKIKGGSSSYKDRQPVTTSNRNPFLEKLGYTGTSTASGIVYTAPTRQDTINTIFKINPTAQSDANTSFINLVTGGTSSIF